MATIADEKRIRERLAKLERQQGCLVLYAVESGSRTWGFASPDSDFDVRGITLYPRDVYLMLERPPEVINFIEDDLDISFWDIYKFMSLAQRSNPSTLEWIGASQVYVKAPATLRHHWTMVDDHHWWSRQRLMHHYLGLAKSEWHKYIADRTSDRVKTKAYFYVMRPLFILEWLFRYNTLPVNQNLLTLMTMLTWGDKERGYRINQEVRSALGMLVLEKGQGSEFDAHQRVPLLDDFIECEFEYWKAIQAEWDMKEKLPAIYEGHANTTLWELHKQYAQGALKPLDSRPE